jgi:hypothetical protein
MRNFIRGLIYATATVIAGSVVLDWIENADHSKGTRRSIAPPEHDVTSDLGEKTTKALLDELASQV